MTKKSSVWTFIELYSVLTFNEIVQTAVFIENEFTNESYFLGFSMKI